MLRGSALTLRLKTCSLFVLFTSPPEKLPTLQPEKEARQEQVPASASPQALSRSVAVALPCSIPGIGERSTIGILAEIGLDRQQFPTAGQLASWAGDCPGDLESAGKRFSDKTRKGSPWLRCLLVQAAHSAARQKQC